MMMDKIRRATIWGIPVAAVLAIAGCQIQEAGTPCGGGLCLQGWVCKRPSNPVLLGTDERCIFPGQCGNGYIDEDNGEECDDGVKNAIRGHCNSECHLNHCGDGHVDLTEECDDGPNNGDDRDCRSDCIINRCGDGYPNTQGVHKEMCDGAPPAKPGSPEAMPVETSECNIDCTMLDCGDRKVNHAAGEECDNGADQNQDNATCTSTCKVSVCGDHHVLEDLEDCDEGGVDTESCNAICTKSVCGDGYVNKAAGEECDDGSDNGTMNSDCDSFCKSNHCGNDIVDVSDGEQCDPGGGSNPTDTETCTHLCRLSRCGDQYINSAAKEKCDDGPSNGDACEYNHPNCTRCNSECTERVHPGGPFCGDGIPQQDEVCEPSRGLNQDAENCDSDCTPVACGDGHRNEVTESCDDGNRDVCGTCQVTDCKIKSAVAAAPASATIETTDADTIASGDTFTLDDGFGNVVTFEFTLSAPPDTTHVAIVIVKSPAPTGAAEIANRMVTAINTKAPPGFLITASVTGGTTVTLTNSRRSSFGNTPIGVTGQIGTSTGFKFTPSSPAMVGGVAGDCRADIGCVSGDDCKSGVCSAMHMCIGCTSGGDCQSGKCNTATHVCR